MAKTAKLKSNAKSKSVHSRAAKRASSPSVNLDKSLTSTKPPPESANQRPSVLAVHYGAGITKKSKKDRPMSRQKRKRQEKGLEKAEAVMDKTEKKVQRSVGRQRVIKDRSAAWNDLNGKIAGSREKETESKEDEWEDEDMREDEHDMGDASEAAGPIVVEQVEGMIEPLSTGQEDEVL
ncbi:MAG: hypothetical protein M1827_001519 [Pycnora praestabilis]|nr:MAG: hypothetical protein M1827_001519 [Pycnora praestabilis]